MSINLNKLLLPHPTPTPRRVLEWLTAPYNHFHDNSWFLDHFSAILRSFKDLFYLTSSSGWFRECRIIGHSLDVDFGMKIEDYSVRLIPAMEMAGLMLVHQFGKVRNFTTFPIHFLSLIFQFFPPLSLVVKRFFSLFFIRYFGLALLKTTLWLSVTSTNKMQY